MIYYDKHVEDMTCIAKEVNHGPAPIPEEGQWVQSKEIKDISGLTHGVGWCAPQQGACKLTLNVKEGIIEEALVETVDTCVGRFVEAIREVGGDVCITADHGNADQMVDPETGAPFTAHTTNPVPFIVVSDRVNWIASDGALCDIAPTLLTLAGMDIPAEMTGSSLVKVK